MTGRGARTSDRFPVDAVRIWQGYRATDYAGRPARFHELLGRVFVPATVQLMEPLGLQAYFPALLPPSGYRLPDEVALVAYPNQDAYRRVTGETTVGRAYGALHSVAFNFAAGSIPRSNSDFAQPWPAPPLLWREQQPYYLLDRPGDWHTGSTLMLAALRRKGMQRRDFRLRVAAAVEAWLRKVPARVDGAFLVGSADHLVYWEHSARLARTCSLYPFLRDLLEEPVLHRRARTVHARPVFSAPDPGIFFQPGDFLDVRPATTPAGTRHDGNRTLPDRTAPR